MKDYIKRVRYDKNYTIKVFENDTSKKGKYRAWAYIDGTISKEAAFYGNSFNVFGDDAEELINSLKKQIDQL